MDDDSLCERLIALLRHERRASSRNLRDIHGRSVAERVEVGEAINGLRTTHVVRSEVTLSCGENLSRFREGDLLWLSDGGDIHAGWPVRYIDHDPVANTVRVEKDRGGDRALPPPPLVLDRRSYDGDDAEVNAVRDLFLSPRLAAAKALLLGRPVVREVASIADRARAGREGLDPVQVEAFVEACTRPVQLIQGPPGSGKTRLAGAIIRAFLDAGRSVLVCAFTHRAVDNVLRAIVSSGPDQGDEDRARGAVPIYKVARRPDPGLAPLGVKCVPRPGSVPALDGPGVVGITASGAPRLRGRRFDLVLVDEAGQVHLAHACGVLPLGDRHVFIGDHKQLPPLLVDEHADRQATASLFEHLDQRIGSRMLTRTYRMCEALCRLPSEQFYGGLLQPAEGNRDHRLVLAPGAEGFPEDVPAVLDPASPLVVIEMEHRGARVVAPDEAALAAHIVAAAIAHGVPPSEIAVLAPHRAQGNRIRAILRANLSADADPTELPVVDTVDRLQGGERDVIVLSLTASDPDAAAAQAGFLFSPNRLNVALTRARKKLIVLMSPAILESFPDDLNALQGAELLRRLWRGSPRLEAAEVRASLGVRTSVRTAECVELPGVEPPD